MRTEYRRRRLIVFTLALSTQLACWSERSFTEACIAAGHCAIDDAGAMGGGSAMGGGGGSAMGGGGGGALGGGGGALGGGGGALGGGGGALGGGTGGGVVSDGGELTWAEVVSDLFPPTGLDAGFTLEFTPAQVAGRWVGGVLTNRGDVICIPSEGNNALRISPDKSVSLINFPTSGSWEGGVLLGDGGVLALPYEAASFLAIADFTATAIDAGLPRAGASSMPYFEGGVITLSRRVLLAPRGDVLPGVYDSDTRVLTLLDGGRPTQIAANASYASAVLLADGESALMVPRYARQPMHVTPMSAELVAGGDFLEGHSGGLLLPDGSVLMIPNSSAQFVKWDGVSVTRMQPNLMTSGYYSAAWSTNGFAYAIQTDGTLSSSSIAVIDRTGMATEIPLALDAGLFQNSHYGLVTNQDGVIVGCPYQSTQVLFIVPSARRTVNLRTMTSPWLNKW